MYIYIFHICVLIFGFLLISKYILEILHSWTWTSRAALVPAKLVSLVICLSPWRARAIVRSILILGCSSVQLINHAQIDKFSKRTYVGPIRHRSRRAAVVPAKLVASVVKSALTPKPVEWELRLQQRHSESFDCNRVFRGDPMEVNQKLATPVLFVWAKA